MTPSGEIRERWADPHAEAAWVEQGRALLAQVRAAVGPEVTVEDRFSRSS